MKKIIQVSTLSLVFFMLSCTAIDTKFNYSDDTNFSNYKSYAWLYDNIIIDIGDGLAILDLPAPGVNEYVDEKMQDKGYHQDRSEPDFLLIVHFGIKEMVDIQDTTPQTKDNYVAGRIKVNVEMYTEGTIVIDIIDTKSLDLVWRGTATKESDEKINEMKIESNIESAIDKLLAKFPPK